MITLETLKSARLDDLIDWAMDAYASARNKQLMQNPRNKRFVAGVGRTVFARVFHFDTRRYFFDPDLCLRTQLQWKLWQFHVLQDDTPFDLKIGCDLATAFEPSLYGVQPLLSEGAEPTYGAPVIRCVSDLDRLSFPDFFSSGWMPAAHEMYEKLHERCRGDLEVFFPGYARGPWSMATILRGFQDLFLDYKDHPAFLHRLMAYCTQSRIEWENERCKFLGITPVDRYYWKYVLYRCNAANDLFEDEVDCQLFSPELYREYILPYHRQLSEYYAGIRYFHSCGNITGILRDIHSLPITQMQHISAATDLNEAVKIVPRGVILQFSLDALRDVYQAEIHDIRTRLRELFISSKDRSIDICADALYSGGEDLLQKLVLIRQIFREECDRYPSPDQALGGTY